MDILLFLPHYMRWHYTRAFRDLNENIVSLLLGVTEFFAFETILATFGSTWMQNGRDTISSSLLSFVYRIANICIQVFLLALGFAVLVVGMFVALIVYALWILYPFILVALLALAIGHLF